MNEKLALKLVKGYLQDQNFNPIRIDPKSIPAGKKSPDFDVQKNKKTNFFCEVKTPQHNLDPKTNMYHWNTAVSKLRDMIHKAIKQFKDHDPTHSKPWVIFFTSDNFQLQWKLFADSILGVITHNGQIIKDMRQQRFVAQSQKDIAEVDLFVWLQVNSKDEKIYQKAFYLNGDSKFYDDAETIRFELLPQGEETKLMFEYKSQKPRESTLQS